jgi:hypothetical protein
MQKVKTRVNKAAAGAGPYFNSGDSSIKNFWNDKENFFSTFGHGI